MKRFLFGTVAFAVAFSSSLACTRILWNNNKYGVLVARSMDWPESTEPILWFLPRGMERDGSR
ncbi:MAG: linear amide C-N hydrolase, partial [Verrucomicrobia bacterium]|nr:linear amide C-N hydrolase [Verrucomicrobiota bacterium]